MIDRFLAEDGPSPALQSVSRGSAEAHASVAVLFDKIQPFRSHGNADILGTERTVDTSRLAIDYAIIDRS